MSKLTVSAMFLFLFGSLAANTLYRFNETHLRSGPFNVLQGIVDFTLTSWLGDHLTALALTVFAIVIVFFTSKKSFESSADTALRNTSATLGEYLHQPIEQRTGPAENSATIGFIATFFYQIRSLGWILLFAGSIPTLITGCDYATGTPTNATVVGLEMQCRVKLCTECTSKMIPCNNVDKEPAGTFILIDRTPFAKVEFQTGSGQLVETKAGFAKLGLKQPVSKGQSIRLRYRTARPSYVSSEKLSSGFLTGISIALCGIILIFLNRYFRGRVRNT